MSTAFGVDVNSNDVSKRRKFESAPLPITSLLENFTPVDTKRALQAVLDNISRAVGATPAFVPVTSAAHIQRLERALQKNFDFIRRFFKLITVQFMI